MSQKNLSYIIFWICLQYFAQGCLAKHILSLVYSRFHRSLFQISWNLHFLFILVLFKKARPLFKIIFRASGFPQRTTYDIDIHTSRGAILHFIFKYKFGIKSCSNQSKAVFIESFLFFLLKMNGF